MIKNLRHVGLVVSDMDRAIKFYQKLGLEIISKAEEHWGPKWIKVCKMTHGLELIEGEWQGHVAFSVDYLEPAAFVMEGEELPYSPEVMWNMKKPGVRFITDPDGNVIELVKEESEDGDV